MPLTQEQKVERAKKAAEARWAARVDWEKIDLEEGMTRLAAMRAEVERGGLILQQRSSNFRVQTAECYNPDCKKGPDGSRTVIDIGSGRFAGQRCRMNPATGIIETAYACSAACFIYMTSHFTHFGPAPRDIVPAQAEPEVVLNESAKNIVGG